MSHVDKAIISSIATLLFSACTPTPEPFLLSGKEPAESAFCKKYSCLPKPPTVVEKEGNSVKIQTYTLSGQDAPTLTYNHFDFRVAQKTEEFSADLRWPGESMRTSVIAQTMVDDLLGSSIGSKPLFKLIQYCVTLSRATEIFVNTGRSLADQQINLTGTDGKKYHVGCILYDNSPNPSMIFTISKKIALQK